MEFSVGQNVVHPAHGAGEIVNVEHQELVEGFKHYYVIRFRGKKLTVRIPVRKTGDLGVREVMSEARLKRVMDALGQIAGGLPDNFKERRTQVEKLIHSGFPLKVAEAVRELSWRKEDAHLTKADTELLSRGREMLITEVALSTDSDVMEAQRMIDDVLAEAIAARVTMLSEQAQEESSRPAG